MASYVSKQIASSAIKTKAGNTVVLGVEHCFPEFFNADFTKDEKNNSTLEPSRLDRFIFKINNKPPKDKGNTISVKANFPSTEVGYVFDFTKQIFEKRNFGNIEKDEIEIYSSPVKYFTEQDDNKHHRCYSLKIKYNKTRNYPIEITIENFFAPLKVEGKMTQIVMSEAHDKTYATMWMSFEEWYKNIIGHIDLCLKSYSYASFEARFKNSLKPR